MLAHGNSDAATCAVNLVRTIRHEVPFDRFKGLPADVVDRTLQDGEAAAKVAVSELLGSYEPRLDVEDVEVALANGPVGSAVIQIKAG